MKTTNKNTQSNTQKAIAQLYTGKIDSMSIKLFVILFLLSGVLFLSGCKITTGSQEIPPTTIKLGQGDFNPVKIYERDGPAVVTIIGAEDNKALDQGSGFLISEDGKIITNAHVVLDEANEPVKQIFIEFSNGQRSEAKALQIDPDIDLAVLEADYPDNVSPLTLSKRTQFLPGEPVAAIGSPFGEAQSLSTGIVSAVDRNVESLTKFSIPNAIQTDASINPGNSGGPLIDSQGEVIGVNQQIISKSGGNDGVGYAIPAAAVEKLMRAVAAEKDNEHTYIGLTTQEVWKELGAELNIPSGSLLIADILPNSPAGKAGLKGGNSIIYFQGSQIATGGDALVRIDGKRLKQADDLSTILDTKSPGDKVRLTIVRNGKKKNIKITLSSRPA